MDDKELKGYVPAKDEIIENLTKELEDLRVDFKESERCLRSMESDLWNEYRRAESHLKVICKMQKERLFILNRVTDICGICKNRNEEDNNDMCEYIDDCDEKLEFFELDMESE